MLAPQNLVAAISVLGGSVPPTETILLQTTNSVADGLSALVGGANPGTLIRTRWSRFTTVTSTNDSASLPPSVPGLELNIRNDGGNTMKIYPATGDTIGGGASTTLANTTSLVLRCFQSGNWIAT